MWARAGMGSACVRAGERSSSEGQLKDADAVSVPIVQTNCYHFDSSEHVIAFHAGEYVSHRYGRYGSPTAKALEQKIARLDDAEACVVSASGMATATSMMLALVPPNGRVVMTSDCYHNTRKLVEHLVSMGTRLAVVEPGDYEALERELDVGADLFFTESPTNPLLRCVDVPRASALCRARGTLFCVDSTFATPINQQPLQLGADIVVHSLTKYLGGHNDVMGGSLSASAEIVDKVRKTHGLLGGVLEPQSAYLLLRGMKTLHVRVERQNETARALARALEKMDGVTAVHYPGLPSHPDHEVARTQMRGHGGVVSFEIDGGLHAAARFVDALQIPMRTASFGGVDSLVQQPTVRACICLLLRLARARRSPPAASQRRGAS